MVELFANSGDTDQMPQNAQNAASDLGLHCLPLTHLEVSRQQWVNPVLVTSQMEIILGGLFDLL